MNPEQRNFNKQENIEVASEQRDLSPEQKKILGEAWTEMIVENVAVPENISEMSSAEMKKWLFDSIMADTGRLIEELDLQADADLATKITNTENLEEKSALELAYIKQAHAQVDEIVKNFDESGNRSSKWDSWPKRMRETKEFNCVGATLLGLKLLEQSGVESYYGNPRGHVLNIVRLANGDWWYVDFRNGARNIIKLEPEETTIAGVPVLKINQPEIDYRLIPLFTSEHVAGSVFGNLSSLQHEASDDSIADENIEKKEAKEYLAKHGPRFAQIDFSEIGEILYPEFTTVRRSNEMRQEKDRIEVIRDFEKPVLDYTRSLAKKQRELLAKEIKNNKAGIEHLFRNGDEAILSAVSPELHKVLELFLASLAGVKENQPEVYQEAVDNIIGRI